MKGQPYSLSVPISFSLCSRHTTAQATRTVFQLKPHETETNSI